MNKQEALEALEISPNASREETAAAFHRCAKKLHPDRNPDMAGNTGPFERALEAYKLLKREFDRQLPTTYSNGNEASSEDAGNENSVSLAMKHLRDFITRHGVEILFDGTMRKASDLRMAVSAHDIQACLSQDDIDFDWVIDNLMEEIDITGVDVTKSDAKRALRMIIRQARARRRTTVLGPLLAPLTTKDMQASEEAWQRLAVATFETDPILVTCCLKHFIWQVKQKALNRPVKRHLMPVIYSPIQGSGKTTFVTRFLKPLRELAPAPVLLSDLADARSGEIFRFPVLVVDDMEKIRANKVAVLKQALSSDGLKRRKLGTSSSPTIKQRATLIGTANNTVDELVADDTGHRRYVTLHFRNGEVAKGGCETVWQEVDAMDCELLWRSVNAFGPSPIEAVLDRLIAAQESNSPYRILQDWLFNLNVGAEAVLNITRKYGGDVGISPTDLHSLFCEQTYREVSSNWFGQQMTSLVQEEKSPFDPQRRKTADRYWPLKKPTFSKE